MWLKLHQTKYNHHISALCANLSLNFPFLSMSLTLASVFSMCWFHLVWLPTIKLSFPFLSYKLSFESSLQLLPLGHHQWLLQSPLRYRPLRYWSGVWEMQYVHRRSSLSNKISTPVIAVPLIYSDTSILLPLLSHYSLYCLLLQPDIKIQSNLSNRHQCHLSAITVVLCPA